MKWWVAAIAGIFVSGCTINVDHNNEQIYKGLYVWGAEVNTFSPCDSAETYWANYSWAGQGLLDFYKQNTTKSYQSIYIEFRGQLLNEEVDGFAADYDGLIRISEVQSFSLEIPEDCKNKKDS